jgi:hypothetical protein
LRLLFLKNNISQKGFSNASQLSFLQSQILSGVGNPSKKQEKFRTSQNDRIVISFGFTDNHLVYP